MTKGQQGYRLESPLGSGGFSEVWRATDLETGEAVAVKVARADRGTEANAKLREEATILRALNHPNIVRILDWGVEDESEFLVTELIDGPTLRDVLRESGALSDEEVLAMGAALADALAAAHEAGFVHGDVKPENIIIRSGTPYLIDFGTARNLAETLRPDELREVAGTLAYLAPELLAGEALSPQSDVYALGVTLYEARSGRLPFAGGGGTLVGSEGRRASPLRHTSPGVDARLESAIMESLAVDPAWRLATAAEVRERLVSGWHDTVQLRPPRSSAAAPALGAGAPAAAALGADAAVASAMAPPSRVAFSNLDDALLEPQDSGPARPRRVLAVVAVLSLLLLGCSGVMRVNRTNQPGATNRLSLLLHRLKVPPWRQRLRPRVLPPSRPNLRRAPRPRRRHRRPTRRLLHRRRRRPYRRTRSKQRRSSMRSPAQAGYYSGMTWSSPTDSMTPTRSGATA